MDLSEVVSARLAYDADLNPSYSGQRCPKLGSTELDPLEQASLLYSYGAMPDAAVQFEAQWKESQEVKWAGLAAKAWRYVGDYERAENLAKAALEAPELPEDQRFSLLTVRIENRLRQGDWETLGTLLEDRARLEPEHRGRRYALQKVLTDPLLREDVATWLTAPRLELGNAYLWALVEAHPDNPHLRWLALADTREPGRNKGLYLDPESREKLQLTFQALRADPTICSRWFDSLTRLGDDLIHANEPGLALEYAEVLLSSCDDSVLQWRADAWKRQVHWQHRQEPMD